MMTFRELCDKAGYGVGRVTNWINLSEGFPPPVSRRGLARLWDESQYDDVI